ncbi:histidine kinase N-terminal 7TM domain-containing protein [Clostridium thailandense]|uniref:histidine kinase N-terminal 7TM domain-containing diguanylate cyclase n=1 Tax=Clostridium thailandense TaxID=2794346 RepID=UPI003989571F
MKQINNFLSGFFYIETFIIFILGAYSWRRRKVPGAFPLFLMCISAVFYTFGYSMEIISVSLQNVNLWSKVQYLGLPFIPSLWVVQAYSLSFRNKKIGRLYKAILFIIPVLTCIFRWTDEYHRLMYKTMSLVNNGYFDVLYFERGIWYYVHCIFFLSCAIISIVIYYRAFLESTGYMRKQFRIMFYASMIPFVSLIFDQLEIVPLGMDCGAFGTIFIYIFFAYAIYRYDMMHIIPLSREKIFEWIYDGAIVVDLNYNLKDFNHAAKQIFQSLDKSLIGTEIELCTNECPEFFELLKDLNGKHRSDSTQKLEESFAEDVFEFSINTLKENIKYFKARLRPLYDKGLRIGSTILITDITKEKEMLLELERIAQLDGLTGILNRRYFIELANDELDRLLQQCGNGVMFMFDIDYFKRINDTYGHQAGDYVLKEIASIVKSIIRANDLLGRYGGEEFIAFLPDLSLNQAMIIVERIRAAFENHTFNYKGKFIKVTASFGVAEYYKHKHESYCSFDEMVMHADSGLYEAKKSGRNKIFLQ